MKTAKFGIRREKCVIYMVYIVRERINRFILFVIKIMCYVLNCLFYSCAFGIMISCYKCALIIMLIKVKNANIWCSLKWQIIYLKQ